MARPEIISPQVKGLYDTVHMQAIEFSKAFEYFEKEKAEFEVLKLELLKSVNALREEFLMTSENLNQSAYSSLKFIEQKAEAISKVYQDIDELKSLKDTYKLSLVELERQAQKLDELMASVKVKNNNDIQNSLLEFKNRIEKDINKHLQKLEIRLLIRLRDFEEKFTLYDKLLLRLNELKSGTLTNSIQEVVQHENETELFIKSINDLKNETSKMLIESEKKLNSEISKLIPRISQLENIISNENNKNKFVPAFDIKNINYKISQIILRLSQLEKAQKKILYLIGMILLLIILLILA